MSGRGIASLVKSYYPSWVVYPVCLLLLAANTIQIGADLGAMAASINMFTGLSAQVVVVPIALAIVALMVFAHYRTVVTVFKWLTVSLFAYVVAAFLAKANWGDVLHHTFLPEFRSDGAFVAMVVAILGTTISPYLFFWQASQEVEEDVAQGNESVRQRKGTTDIEMEERHMDVNVGMGISNLVMFFIILTTGQLSSPVARPPSPVPMTPPRRSYLWLAPRRSGCLVSVCWAPGCSPSQCWQAPPPTP